MTEAWSPQERRLIDGAGELQIAAERIDGTLYRWTPIWVVSVDGNVYVRTWYRRDTGWFGHVLRSGRARIRVPDLETDAAVEDVGEGPTGLRERIDTAYRDKYGRSSSSSMVGAAAAAATLRLRPENRGPSLNSQV